MSFRTTGIPVSERPDLNRILAIGLKHAMVGLSIGVTGDASPGGVLLLMQNAASQGDHAMVDTLIQNGKDIEEQDEEGWTPLLFAAANGLDQVGRTLLNANAKVNHQNAISWTALIYTSYFGYDSFARILIDHNATVNYQTTDGLTALMVAAKRGHPKVVRLLLEHTSADDVDRPVIKKKSHADWTALMFAASGGHTDIANMLLRGGAKVNYSTPYKTALMVSAIYGYELVTQTLLSFDADIDQSFDEGKTALVFAAEHGHNPVCIVLLDKGANVNHTTKRKLTALMAGSGAAHAFEPHKLRAACGPGHISVVRTLLKRGAAVDEFDIFEYTALMYSAQAGCHETMGVLLEYAASVDIARLDKTALTLAIEYKKPLCLRQLLRAGASISPDDEKMATALSVEEKKVFKESRIAWESIAVSALPVGLMIKRAVEPWSTKTHELFPAATRSKAVEMFRLGYLLAGTSLFESELLELLDTWRDNIMPHLYRR